MMVSVANDMRSGIGTPGTKEVEQRNASRPECGLQAVSQSRALLLGHSAGTRVVELPAIEDLELVRDVYKKNPRSPLEQRINGRVQIERKNIVGKP